MRAPVVFEKHNQSSAQQALFLIALSHLWPAYVDIGEFAAATRGQETAGTSQETAGAPKKKGSFFKRLWHQIRPKTLKRITSERGIPNMWISEAFRKVLRQQRPGGRISTRMCRCSLRGQRPRRRIITRRIITKKWGRTRSTLKSLPSQSTQKATLPSQSTSSQSATHLSLR
eukprot:Gregarina_sp_Pseudo_9__1704@NODE_2155_length_1124_cov_91_189862_g1984_i0_p1_GENE_NODE_2155_length_1124_cov_91_189862_g1984_i0NODE_2155_length_1124_cov_91_189862_g1984_i0_p1_ORF_typecomplete_len172_score8_21Methyltransf_30/PF05430_11/0_2_NODE_2155_length_1124_cov_91_189862_g1984_i05621077